MADAEEFQWIRRGDGEWVLHQHGHICVDREVIAAQRAKRDLEREQRELEQRSLISGA